MEARVLDHSQRLCKSVRDAGRRWNSREGSYGAVAAILLVIC